MDNTGLRGLYEAFMLQNKGRFNKEEKLRELALLEVELKGIEGNRSKYSREEFNILSSIAFSTMGIVMAIATGATALATDKKGIFITVWLGISIMLIYYAYNIRQEGNVKKKFDGKFNIEKDEICKLEIEIKALKNLLFIEDNYRV
ncbi:hypothetical protein KPL39_02085 [Clostridium gasigenes]|uniref:hypothetical protein n=1 Tax=Clostridium gasigenes TaxID=94869 RepID=UPI001C0CD44A|nr:hypothetical protein [Clostridium gasigenes]MBU3135050.1 hypothetical protein [Clostridium gasigenes]